MDNIFTGKLKFTQKNRITPQEEYEEVQYTEDDLKRLADTTLLSLFESLCRMGVGPFDCRLVKLRDILAKRMQYGSQFQVQGK